MIEAGLPTVWELFHQSLTQVRGPDPDYGAITPE
jgi:hypothetical protein